MGQQNNAVNGWDKQSSMKREWLDNSPGRRKREEGCTSSFSSSFFSTSTVGAQTIWASNRCRRMKSYVLFRFDLRDGGRGKWMDWWWIDRGMHGWWRLSGTHVCHSNKDTLLFHAQGQGLVYTLLEELQWHMRFDKYFHLIMCVQHMKYPKEQHLTLNWRQALLLNLILVSKSKSGSQPRHVITMS